MTPSPAAGLDDQSLERRSARAERAAYRRAGRDPQILDRLAMAVEPGCAGVQPVNGRMRAVLDFTYHWYVPDARAASEIYGGRLTSRWPANEAEATNRLRRVIGRSNESVRFGALPAGLTDPNVIGPGLPTCGAQGEEPAM